MQKYKSILFLIFSVVSIYLLCVYLDYDNDNAFGEIATFISILIGFTITALSIIANSSFAVHLYKIEDSKNNSKTLLHTLINKFKIAIYIFTFTMVILLIYFFLKSEMNITFRIFGNEMTIKEVVKNSVWYFTAVSLVTFIYALRKLLLFIVRVDKNSKY